MTSRDYPAQELAFLDAIRCDPSDDVSRLVYADWLDEHGEPWLTEFIRLACCHDGLTHGHVGCHQVEARMDALSAANAPRWVGDLGCLFSFHGYFYRGIPEVVHSQRVYKYYHRGGGAFSVLRPPGRCLVSFHLHVTPDYGRHADTSRCWFDPVASFAQPVSALATSLSLLFGANDDGMQLKVKACEGIITALADSQALDPKRTPRVFIHDAHPRVVRCAERRLGERFRVIPVGGQSAGLDASPLP